MAFTRRALFRKGLLGGALLAIGGTGVVALRGTRLGPEPKSALKLFSREEHSIFAAIAARIVPGDGAPANWPRAQDLDCAGKADAVLARVHPEVGSEFGQLLRLFENGVSGLLLGKRPAPFTTLDAAGQDARLEAWRTSRVALLRTGYQAFARLAQATYYSAPEVHGLVGYPGPPEVPA
ncbi:MAG TPA: hypothetical protein VGF45_04165 [Polyangia bacterium]